MSQAPTSTLMGNAWRQASASLRYGRGWKATFAAFATMLLLLQGLLLCAAGAHAFGRLVMQREGLHLDVSSSARDQDIQELYATLQALPSVRYVDFVPKEKAYEREKVANPDIVAFFEEYKLANPLPDSFVVILRDENDFPGFIAQMQGEEYRKVLEPSSLAMASAQENDLREVLGMVSAFRAVALGLAGLAVLVLCAMMAEYVSRAVRERRDEFLLQEAMGASGISLSSLLASELSIILSRAFATSIVIVAALLGLAAFFFRRAMEHESVAIDATLWPYLTIAVCVALVGEMIVLPLLAWGVASRGVRKGLSHPL